MVNILKEQMARCYKERFSNYSILHVDLAFVQAHNIWVILYESSNVGKSLAKYTKLYDEEYCMTMLFDTDFFWN